MHAIRNELQVALLFDKPKAVDITLLLENFLKIEKNERGAQYNVIETDGKRFARCFGGPDQNVMVFIERVDKPTDAQLFANALQSPFNRMVTPDIDERVKRHKGYLLINVHHGAMSSSVLNATPEIAAMMQDFGMQPGQTVPEFQERLRILGLLTAIACDISKPTLGHWTHSETLADPVKVQEFITDSGPSPLNVHPVLHRVAGGSKDEIVVGTTTVGARNFIGGEIDIVPTVLPWGETFQHAIAFLRFAIGEKGYIIPDGDTFAGEEGEFCYRVRHLPAGDGRLPVYELTPLFNKEHGFQSAQYIPPDVKLDLDRPQPEFIDTRSREGQALITQMRAKQRAAQAAGAQFVVKVDPAKAGGNTAVAKTGASKGKSLLQQIGISASPDARSPAQWLLLILAVAVIYMIKSRFPS